MKQVSAALVSAQRSFGPALKSSTNPHFKSKYADLGACVDAVIGALNANGIALVQKQHPSEGGVAVETLFVHESGEVFSAGTISVPAAKQDPQGYGSALTYARRYGLMAACGIAPEDDDGNAAVAAQRAKQREQWLKRHADLMGSCGTLAELESAFKAAFRVATAENDKDAIDQLTAVKDDRKAELSK